MSETANLGLPFIEASQAQKHVTHNHSLLILDGLVQIGIVDRTLATPPPNPSEGAAYIPATGAVSDWAGRDDTIALWQDGAWQFHVPKHGWQVYLIGENAFAFWDGITWTKTAETISSLNNLAFLGVNATADNTNKLSVSSQAVLFNHNGNGVQQKLNKNLSGDTASVLFQTGFAGRAEIGTTGDDDFHFKVSADGNNWNEAINLDRNTGGASFPNGALLERHLPASVDEAGGTDWWGAADHLTTSSSSNSTLTPVADRMHFAAFHVPRPLQLIGCFLSQSAASTSSGALLRAGIFQLGQPDGNNWEIGSRVVDFGTRAGDVAGNKVFDLANPLVLDPGWYLTAFGISGAGAKVLYARWATPGLTRYFPYGSGTTARPRMVGPSAYFFENNCNSEILTGLPPTWAKNPVSDISTTNNWVYQCVFPKWREI